MSVFFKIRKKYNEMEIDKWKSCQNTKWTLTIKKIKNHPPSFSIIYVPLSRELIVSNLGNYILYLYEVKDQQFVYSGNYAPKGLKE